MVVTDIIDPNISIGINTLHVNESTEFLIDEKKEQEQEQKPKQEQEKPDRRKSWKRWLVLLLQCMSSFGIYYCKDIFGVLYNTLNLQFADMEPDTFQNYFSLLYSIYAIPNIILPFIGGLLTVKFGARFMYIVYTGLIALGQLIIAFGSMKSSMTVMLIGRVVMGLGGESINTSKNTIITKWFFKSEVGLPFGISISLIRLGSISSDIISPRLIDEKTFTTRPLFFAFFVCVLSVISTIFIVIMDLAQDKVEGEDEIKELESEADTFSSGTLTYLKELDFIYWLTTIIFTLLFASFLSFKYFSTGWLTSTTFAYIPNKKIAEEKAGLYISVPYLISTLLIPPFGYLIDIIGQRGYLTLGSSIVCFLSYIALYFMNPLVGFALSGLSFSVYSVATWTIISIFCGKNRRGLAFGIRNSIQNLGYVIIPTIANIIYTSTHSYYKTFSIYVVLNFAAVVLSIMMCASNYKRNGILNDNKFDESKNQKEEKTELKDLEK